MANGVCEMLWLRTLLQELGFIIRIPMSLYYDNKAATSIAHSPIQHDRTKHIEVDRHFIREKLLTGLICTPFVKTQQQLADILTKGTIKLKLHEIIGKLGMYDIYAPT